MVADHGVAFLWSELYKSIINKSLMFCSQVTGFIPNNKYINIIKIQALSIWCNPSLQLLSHHIPLSFHKMIPASNVCHALIMKIKLNILFTPTGLKSLSREKYLLSVSGMAGSDLGAAFIGMSRSGSLDSLATLHSRGTVRPRCRQAF